MIPFNDLNGTPCYPVPMPLLLDFSLAHWVVPCSALAEALKDPNVAGFIVEPIQGACVCAFHSSYRCEMPLAASSLVFALDDAIIDLGAGQARPA